MIHVSDSRVRGFVRPLIKYVVVIAFSLAAGIALAWYAWPVQWQGALPVDLLGAYKILIVNSLAEDQQISGSDSLSPGAAKILGYIASDPRLAVNEALGLLRADGNSGLILDEGEQELIEANLLALQGMLIDGPQTPDGSALPVSEGSPPPELVRDNRFIQLFSLLSSLVLVAGLLFVAWRLIAQEAAAGTEGEAVASMHSDVDLGAGGGLRTPFGKFTVFLEQARTRLRDVGLTRFGTEDSASEDEAAELEDPEYQEYREPRPRR
ncbi:MAG: hypothetical protein F4Y80_12160 [Caldilineaceae bacterium SB0665_bin_21]|nr:hypothetical protein [Caldilineaceae bacterium SB0665_bin_21]MYA04163.1 hypothetical protein [Caldilineaceae bacterium SB0664_bin_22]MYC61319.1 hypothetical protein [Caldilineaceae bacterium SB0661_bin_34]